MMFKKLKSPKFGYKVLNDEEVKGVVGYFNHQKNEKKRLLKNKRKKDKNAGRK